MTDNLEPYDNNNQNNKTNKRRYFALIGGLIGAIAIGIYITTALFPSRLFSMAQDYAPVEQKPIPYNAHPVVPDGPFKKSGEELFSSNEDVWAKLFRQMDKKYTKSSLQLFEDTVAANGCGYSKPVTGPFYCTEDKTIYLDITFFEAIKKHSPSSSGLAEAYLVAHQVGHHIQQLLGLDEKLEEARRRLNDMDYKTLLQKREFQADFYAGVWAHHAYNKIFEHTDLAVAISAATQISNDINKLSDRAEPDPLNYADITKHAAWFERGYSSGSIKQGESVFAANDLK